VRVLAAVHNDDAGPGVFGQVAREAGHELVQWRPDRIAPPDLSGVGAAMVFGGAMNVDQEDVHPWLREEKELLRDLLSRGVPVIGLCLGAQLLAEAAGATPRRASEPEIGWKPVKLTPEGRHDPLLAAIPHLLDAFEWHSYEAPLPEGAVALARSPVCLQAYRLNGSPAWGLQFHAEVTEQDLNRWFDAWTTDADAVRSGLDPEALRAESSRRIEAWNEVGRGIAARFLAEAARSPS
jgi:GMP synthase-like glutamine amidotransferase